MATSVINTKKWETKINATATNIKEVKAFIDQRLLTYKENRWKGFNLWESFINDYKSFTKDILNDLNKDQLKKIRDYLCKNSIYIWKEARKSITDGLLGAIHKPTPLKQPADDPANDPANDPADDPADDPTNDPANDPTNDPTAALPLLLTAPVRITQATDQFALQGNFRREIANLTKFYINKVKYSGKQDNFN